MEWSDIGIILSATPHGERAAIVNVLSAQNGRWLGRVNAAQKGAKKAWLSAGTIVQAEWHARLEEQLGSFALEPIYHSSAYVFDEPAALLALDYVTTLTADVTPERLPLPIMFEILHHYIKRDYALANVVEFERMLLDAMGYGLDLTSCAVTGQRNDLTHISPNTGRAVCAVEAAPYQDRLLALPAYWRDKSTPSDAEVRAAAEVTGYFINQHFYAQVKTMPVQRQQLLSMIPAIND